MRRSAGPTKATGNNAGRISGGADFSFGLRRCQMLARQRAHVGKRRPQRLTRLPGENLLAVDAMAVQHIERHIKLTPRRMARKTVTEFRRSRRRCRHPSVTISLTAPPLPRISAAMANSADCVLMP